MKIGQPVTIGILIAPAILRTFVHARARTVVAFPAEAAAVLQRVPPALRSIRT